MRITIATSIVPRNFQHQRDAINSWKKLGFEVISANSPKEIELIKEYFPDVNFATVKRNGLTITGKPLVYFDDIIQILEFTKSELCGIVNSDIFLFADESLIEFIAKELGDGFIFGSRIDISTLSSFVGEEYIQGFDYFFFSHKIMKNYMPTDFCLGAPWWDYWAPLVPIIKGFPVKHLLTPFAYHLQHSTRWSGKQVSEFGNKFINYLLNEQVSKYIEGELVEIINENKKKLCVTSLGLKLWSFINYKSELLFHHKTDETKAMRSVSYEDYLAIKDELEYYKKHERLLEKFAINQISKLENNFSNSLSWRLTAPFRWIYSQLQKNNE